MCLSRNIVLNNSLLLNYLILGLSSYYNSLSPRALLFTHYSKTNPSRPTPLEDFVSLSFRSPSIDPQTENIIERIFLLSVNISSPMIVLWIILFSSVNICARFLLYSSLIILYIALFSSEQR